MTHQDPATNPQAQDTPAIPPASATVVLSAALLTGLSFGAAMRAADPDSGVVAGIAWATASGIAMLSSGDALKTHGLVRIGKIKSGASRLLVRVGAMTGSLLAVEHMINSPNDLAAFGMAAAATVVGAAITATTFNAPAPMQGKARKPAP